MTGSFDLEDDACDGEDAYRVAGQIVAALAHAVPIVSVAFDGLEIEIGSRGNRPRAEVLADAAVGMTGIVALVCFGFGWSGPYDGLSFHDFNDCQLDDFEAVQKLITEIDPDGDQDVFFQLWRQARDFIGLEAVWRATQRIACAILDGNLDVDALTALVGGDAKALVLWP
jgi:hypothetical protein